MRPYSKIILTLALLTLLYSTAAFPGENLITGMFSQNYSPQEQDFIDRKFKQEGISTLSGPDLKIEKTGKTSYIYPQGIKLEKFDKNIFNTSLQNSPGYKERKNFQIIVEESNSINNLENKGYIKIKSKFKSSDYTAIEIIDSPSQVFQNISKSKSKNAILDYKVKSLNNGADDTLGGPTIRNELGINGSGIKIAILDTGVNSNHPDFQGRIVDQEDFTGEGIGDDNGHGTHTAGSALGDGSQSNGEMAGTAPNASLMSVKVLGADGTGSFSDIINGMEYAADNGADVLSMSLGAYVTDEYTPITDAVKYARDRDAAVIAAAGNDYLYNYTSIPAAVEEAIAVGATDETGGVASFTSRGPVPYDSRPKPDVAAPGVNINSTDYDTSSGYYTEKSGTSMSTPLISGIAALALEENTGWNNEDLENAIIASGSTNKADNGFNVFQVGTGVINATRTVNPEITFSETRFNFLNTSAYVDHPANVTITNQRSQSVNYSINSQIHRYNSTNGITTASNASLTFDKEYIQLDAGESKKLYMNFTITEKYSDPFGALIRLNEVDSTESYGLLAGGYSKDTGVKANFTLNATEIDISEKVKADASSSEPDSPSYSWSMGDGTSLSGEIVEHSYSSLDTFTIKLVVENNGQTSSAQDTIQVKDLYPPNPALSINTSEAEVATEDVKFDASASTDNYQIDRYEWDFNADGTTDFTTTNPTLVKKLNDTKTYDIKLTVYDTSDQGDSIQKQVDAVDTTPPDAIADSNSTNLEIGEDVELDASGSTDNHQIKNYTWNVSSLTGETVTTDFDEPGTKNIGLDVYDQSENLGEDSLTLDVSDNTPPHPDINISPDPAEANLEQITFNASNSFDNVEISQYRWDLYQNGTTESGKTLSKTLESPGTYSVELEVEDTSGNTNSTVSNFEVEDTTKPNPDLNLSSTYPETGETITLNASDSTDNHQIKNYSWKTGDGTENTSEIAQHSYSSEGNYTVTLEIYDESENRETDTAEVEVEDLAATFASPQDQVNEEEQWINTSYTRPVTDVNISVDSQDLAVNEENSTYFYASTNLSEGNSTIQLEASDDSGHSTTNSKEVEALYDPIIEFLDIKPRLANDQVNFTANITEDNFNQTNLTVELPNSTERSLDIQNTTKKEGETSWNTSYNPEENGTYYADLTVKDDFDLNTSTSKEFKVSKPVDFNTTFSNQGVEWNLKDRYGDKRKNGSEDFNISIPSDDDWELNIEDNTLNTTINGTNVTENTNTTVKWDTEAPNPSLSNMNELETAALKPDVNFTDATVNISVSGAEKLYKCSSYNFTTEECNNDWNDITDQASFKTNSVSLNTDTFSAFTAAEEESSDDDSGSDDGSSDSSDSSGGSSSGSPSFGGAPPSPEIEIETTSDSIYIYNIYENNRVEPNTSLPINAISFEPENPDNETLNIQEETDFEGSMQSTFRINTTLQKFTLEMSLSQEWLDQNNFSTENTSFFKRKNETWEDTNPEKNGLNLNASVENGVYGLGSQKSCFSNQTISAVTSSCKVYENPCQVPENAEKVDNCQEYNQEQEIRQEIREAKQEASDKDLEKIEEAEKLLEEGKIQQARQKLDQIDEKQSSYPNYLIFAVALASIIFVVAAAYIFYHRRKRKEILRQVQELTELVKKMDKEGRNVRTAEQKLLEANNAIDNQDYDKAVNLTHEIKRLLK